MTSGDWINASMLLVAVLALLWSAWSHRLQANATDFSSYLSLLERYSSAWRQFRDAEDKNKKYELLEVLNLIEGTCHLYNNKLINGTTKIMIRAYLREIIEGLYKNSDANDIIIKSFSGQDTFRQTRLFSKKNNIDGVPEP